MNALEQHKNALSKLPTEKEMQTLENSVVSADITGQDYVIKDLKLQIDKLTRKVRKYKKFINENKSTCSQER